MGIACAAAAGTSGVASRVAGREVSEATGGQSQGSIADQLEVMTPHGRGPCVRRTNKKPWRVDAPGLSEPMRPRRMEPWSLRQESNLYLALRRRPFYPLNYGERRSRKAAIVARRCETGQKRRARASSIWVWLLEKRDAVRTL